MLKILPYNIGTFKSVHKVIIEGDGVIDLSRALVMMKIAITVENTNVFMSIKVFVFIIDKSNIGLKSFIQQKEK